MYSNLFNFIKMISLINLDFLNKTNQRCFKIRIIALIKIFVNVITHAKLSSRTVKIDSISRRVKIKFKINSLTNRLGNDV